jgi:PAS domain S-box-containing protein
MSEPKPSERADPEMVGGGRVPEVVGTAESNFRGLVEQALVGFYIIQDGRFAYVNPRLAEVLGYSADEMMSAPSVLDFVAPVDRPTVEENLRRPLAGEIPALHYIFRGLRKDGTIVDLEVRGGRMEHRGRPAVIGTFLDITERKRVEDDLRRSERRFRMLFAAAADGILLLSPNGDLLDANPAGETIFAVARARLLGLNLLDFVFPDDVTRAQGYLRDVITREPISEPFEIDLRTAAGIRRRISVRSRYVQGEATDAYVEMIARDVTEEREMDRRLMESERLASMGQMAAYVAHEINTPLANIALLTAAASRSTTDPGLAVRLEKINVQRRRAASIISDLLSISRHREIQGREADLRAAIVSAAEQVEVYRKPAVEITLDVSADLRSAWIDPLQMQEVFANLLKNAFEATDAGSVLVRVEQDSAGHRILVTDTGSGISKDLIGRVFEPFFTTKRKAGGTGLGLAFCMNVVRAHGGDVLVDSVEGRGTTFTVVLPRRAPT